MEEGGKLHTLPDVEAADPLGAVELVGAEGEKIDGYPLDIHRNLPDGLDGVGMEEDPLLLGVFGQLLNGEDQPRFVVGGHDGDQCRLIGVQVGLQRLQVHDAPVVDREGNHLGADALQEAAGMADGGVFHLGRDDPLLRGVADDVEVDSLEDIVVPLGAASVHEDVVLVGGVDSLVEPIDGNSKVGVNLSPEGVQGVRVPVELGQERVHRLLDLGVHQGGGVVVQVDSLHEPSREDLVVGLPRGKL